MAQAEPALDPEAEPKTRKSRKKLFVLLGAGLLLLGGAGGGAWYFFSQPSSSQAEAEVQKAPVFVRLDTFTVNIEPAEEERYLQIEIVLRVPDDKQTEIFKQHMPEVRSRLLILLSSKHAEELIPAEGKKKLMSEIVEVLKRPFNAKGLPQKVDGVFFTSFVIQ